MTKSYQVLRLVTRITNNFQKKKFCKCFIYLKANQMHASGFSPKAKASDGS